MCVFCAGVCSDQSVKICCLFGGAANLRCMFVFSIFYFSVWCIPYIKTFEMIILSTKVTIYESQNTRMKVKVCVFCNIVRGTMFLVVFL